MGIKLIGGILLCISGVIMALSHRRFQMRKLNTVDGFISLIFYVKGQIDCFSRPRAEILSTLPAEVFRACNCPDGAETLDELLESSRAYLDEECLRLISSFVAEFGSTFRDEQLRRCDYYISMLGEERKKLYLSTRSSIRAGGALWVFEFVGFLILLWYDH